MTVAAIFDVDGTLVTFQFDMKGTRQALIEELARRGYDPAGIDLKTPTQTILDAARSQTSTDEQGRYEGLRTAAFDLLDRFEAVSASTTAPIAGVRGALERLKSRGVRIAVLTNSGRNAASVSLRRAGLTDLFEFVLTRDETIVMKPNPGGLAMAASRFGPTVESVYYVGDSPYDIAAARGAGVKMVAVATGSYSAERLRSEGADLVVASVADVPVVLGV
ncbi:MAG: HAD family hydrolase [Nitrososphaerota archaeon]|nr:HAD family hydrolase [Nitrososphaerota archaeon]